MRFFSYQNKRRLKIAFTILGAVVVLFFLICVCRYFYLERFLIYTETEVRLDYDQSLTRDSNQQSAPWSEDPIEITYEEPVVQTSALTSAPLKQLTGYYITTQMLLDMDSLRSALASIQETPDTLMFDLKSIYGNFYYSTQIDGALTSSADIAAIDALIGQVTNEKNCYLVARVASLSDTNFALENQSCGLPLRSGALWMSNDGCYWLDPMNEDVQKYLVLIARELAALGFDEVVFDDFRIPDSTNIIYRNELSREEAAAEAAKMIREKLSDLPVRICFNSSDPLVADHSDRVYMVCHDGASVASMVDAVKDCVEDPSTGIVFLTASRDTRFDGYGILRPLIEERQE